MAPKRRLSDAWAAALGIERATPPSRFDAFYLLPDPWRIGSDEWETRRLHLTNEWLFSNFGRVGSLLEIGCGEGHQTAYFSKLAREIVAIDTARLPIRRAQKRMPSVEFICSDFMIYETSRRFDLVVAMEVLYYLQDIPAAIRRMQQLGRACCVGYFGSAIPLLDPHLQKVPGVKFHTLQEDARHQIRFAWWSNS